MKKLAKSIISIISIILPASLFATGQIYQAGTLINLLDGVYTGSTTLGNLAKFGDIGLGTPDGLSGEMVEVNDKFYAADGQGNAKLIPDNITTPFAMVVKFQPKKIIVLRNIGNIDQFKDALNSHITSNNLFYVIKVTGTFNYIKARSIIPPKKPYQPLKQVIKTNQRIFYFHNIPGTLVIFKAPNFMAPITVPGYHIHFISKDRKKMGHVFDLRFKIVSARIEPIQQFALILPKSKNYLAANLATSSKQTINRLEKRR